MTSTLHSPLSTFGAAAPTSVAAAPGLLPDSLSGSRSGSGQDARLRKHADYQRVYKATRKQFSASMTWFLAERALEGAESPVSSQAVASGPRVGLTAGKVLGKAHERNRIKRRMREAVRHHLRELPDGVDLVLHPRRSVMTMEFVKLDAEVLRIFRQAAAQVRERARQRKIPATQGPVAGPPPTAS